LALPYLVISGTESVASYCQRSKAMRREPIDPGRGDIASERFPRHSGWAASALNEAVCAPRPLRRMPLGEQLREQYSDSRSGALGRRSVAANEDQVVHSVVVVARLRRRAARCGAN